MVTMGPWSLIGDSFHGIFWHMFLEFMILVIPDVPVLENHPFLDSITYFWIIEKSTRFVDDFISTQCYSPLPLFVVGESCQRVDSDQNLWGQHEQFSSSFSAGLGIHQLFEGQELFLESTCHSSNTLW